MTDNSNEKKQIRFIDSNYNTLFTIPDGGKIYLTYSDGEQAERICKYIDPTHFETEHNCWHICQFAECMETNKTKYAPILLPDNMPYRSYSVNQVSGELILLKYGEIGYFSCNFSTSNKETNAIKADWINKRLGITKAQAAAMQGGSIFGWDKPIANPENYTVDGILGPIDGADFKQKEQEYQNIDDYAEEEQDNEI